MSLIQSYKSTLKPKGIEEYIDLIFYRPLGFLWALIFYRLKWISPTMVSILSGFLGVVSGILIAQGNLLVGIILINLAVILDCSDGQLARMRQSSSPIGRIVDGVIDYICFVSLFVGMLFFFLNQGYSFLPIFSFLLVAGVSLSIQAASLDYYRNNYLNENTTKQDFDKEIANVQKIQSQSSFLIKWMCQFYLIYMKSQIAMLDKKSFPQIHIDQIKKRRIYGTSMHVFLISICLFSHRMDIYGVISIIGFNFYMIILKITKQ